MPLLLLWHPKKKASTPTTPRVIARELPGGGGTVNQWRTIMRRRRLRAIDDAELQLFSRMAVEQIVRDYMGVTT